MAIALTANESAPKAMGRLVASAASGAVALAASGAARGLTR
jgi:hypothetical protein